MTNTLLERMEPSFVQLEKALDILTGESAFHGDLTKADIIQAGDCAKEGMLGLWLIVNDEAKKEKSDESL